MDVELQYFDGCPNWTVAQERLLEALRRAGHDDVSIVLRRVETHEDAVAANFRGSPSFLINGTDPFPTGEGAPGLSCRVYRSPTGLSGCPSVEDLVTALG
ncbi:MAG: thioredoxin family protein [Frankiales bacterium]|nr:thioredoxin family protein [Frankiales bacterium]